MKVLKICSPAIKDMLDIGVIVPHLNANNLLTKDNVKMLTNMSKTQQEKTEYLVYILPRKNYGWFEKFLQCLEKSAEVARHADLVKELTVTLDDMKQLNDSKQTLVGECAAANEVAMSCGSGREEVLISNVLCIAYRLVFYPDLSKYQPGKSLNFPPKFPSRYMQIQFNKQPPAY